MGSHNESAGRAGDHRQRSQATTIPATASMPRAPAAAGRAAGPTRGADGRPEGRPPVGRARPPRAGGVGEGGPVAAVGAVHGVPLGRLTTFRSIEDDRPGAGGL
jgi:hypothetical protein